MINRQQTHSYRLSLYCALFILGFSYTIKAQDRVSRPIYSFDAKSVIVSNIQGWIYDRDKGNWHNANNVITTKHYDKIGANNIYSLQMLTFSYNTIKYNILCVEDLNFYYDYPYIQEGKHSYTEWHYYLLPNEVLADIKDLTIGRPTLIYCLHYLKNNIAHDYTDDEIIYNFINYLDAHPSTPAQKRKKKLRQPEDGFMVVCKVDENTLRLNMAQNKRPDVYSVEDYTTRAIDNKTNFIQYFELDINDWGQLFIDKL